MMNGRGLLIVNMAKKKNKEIEKNEILRNKSVLPTQITQDCSKENMRSEESTPTTSTDVRTIVLQEITDNIDSMSNSQNEYTIPSDPLSKIDNTDLVNILNHDSCTLRHRNDKIPENENEAEPIQMKLPITHNQTSVLHEAIDHIDSASSLQNNSTSIGPSRNGNILSIQVDTEYDTFSEDDDDSVKDPNYDSDSSSSTSSTSSSSSNDSSTSARPSGEVAVLQVDITNNRINETSSDERIESRHSISPSPHQSDNTDIEVMKKKGKKRVANMEEWKSIKAKKLRNTGQPYTSRSKSHKKFGARKIRTPCGEKCRLKCTTKIDNDTRCRLFGSYWSLADINRQRDFLHKCMIPIKPTYRYSKTEKPRNYNHAFYFYINEQKVRVCKYYFMATLDINTRTIRTVIRKSNNGFVMADQRGKHHNHKKIDSAIKEGVRSHINSIPRIESHYLRKQTTRHYIDGGKNLTDIYNDYKLVCENNNEPHVNLVMFSKIFNTEYNISFFKPKKDRCELCDSYENAMGDDKESLKQKFELHHEEKVLSRLEKEEDKKKSCSNYVVAVYDLQAVLQCPRGEVSVFYYRSKLNNYNFSISELKTGETQCYLWHEAQGNRGADEIGSCVLNLIEKTVHKMEGTIVDFVFYSDNCCGQQKNQFLVAMYIYALKKYSNINSITHKYLITGHTQNEGDAVHSTIEKEIKKCLKSGPIYVPSQYAQIIRTAKKRGDPYHVNELSYRDFYALKTLVDGMSLTGFKSLKISEIKIFKLTQNSPTTIHYKTSYKQDEFKQMELCRKKNISVPIILKAAYKNAPNIKENKKKDLLYLCEHNHIPYCYIEFLKSL